MLFYAVQPVHCNLHRIDLISDPTIIVISVAIFFITHCIVSFTIWVPTNIITNCGPSVVTIIIILSLLLGLLSVFYLILWYLYLSIASVLSLSRSLSREDRKSNRRIYRFIFPLYYRYRYYRYITYLLCIVIVFFFLRFRNNRNYVIIIVTLSHRFYECKWHIETRRIAIHAKSSQYVYMTPCLISKHASIKVNWIYSFRYYCYRSQSSPFRY